MLESLWKLAHTIFPRVPSISMIRAGTDKHIALRVSPIKWKLSAISYQPSAIS